MNIYFIKFRVEFFLEFPSLDLFHSDFWIEFFFQVLLLEFFPVLTDVNKSLTCKEA